MNELTRTVRPLLHAYYLEDTTGNLTCQDIAASKEKYFVPSSTGTLNFGYSKSVYWIKFNIQYDPKEADDRDKEWVLEIAYPLLKAVDVYISDGNSTIIKHAGIVVPYSKKEIRHRNTAFLLKTKSGVTCRIFMRIKSEGAMNIPIVLWDPMQFSESTMREQYVLGIYYGILIVMAMFNLFVFAGIRSRAYLYYVLYIVSVIFWQLSYNGLGALYLMPEHPWLFGRALPVFGSLLAVFMNIFSRDFLQTKYHTPKLDKILNFIVVLFIINTAASFYMPYAAAIQVVSFLSIAGSTVLFITSVQCFTKGYRAARLYLISWIMLMFGFIVLPLKNFGLLPHSGFTDYSVQIGSAFEVIFMSLALADRFRLMQRDKEEVQRKALEHQRRMADSFARFVPKEFLTFLKRDNIADVGLGDQVIKDMAILFSDIRSFTALSEKMSPQENIDFINSYLNRIAPIIRNNNGFIDKYIGDAIMALFPGSIDDAIHAAVAMHHEVAEFNISRGMTGGAAISIGIGIHWGKLMLGTIGETHRIETTVISDAVNTASRLEGLNKQYGSKIIISRESFDLAADKHRYSYRDLGTVSIRGKDRQVEIIEILLPAG